MINGLIGLMATLVTDPSTFDPVAYNAPASHVEHPLFTWPEPATLALGLIGGALLLLLVRAKRLSHVDHTVACGSETDSLPTGRQAKSPPGKKHAA